MTTRLDAESRLAPAPVVALTLDKESMDLDKLPWRGIEARNEEGAILVRERKFPADFPKTAFSHRLNVFWAFAAPHESGFPDTEEFDRMRTFEDRLVEATEPDLQAALSLVVTGKNQREYVFHSRNPHEFLRRLTEMPQEEERYPIEIHHTEDPSWDYVGQVLRDIGIE